MREKGSAHIMEEGYRKPNSTFYRDNQWEYNGQRPKRFAGGYPDEYGNFNMY